METVSIPFSVLKGSPITANRRSRSIGDSPALTRSTATEMAR